MMINDMTRDSNTEWKERVNCLNNLHDHLQTLGKHAEAIRGLKNREKSRSLIHRLVGILYQLDVLMDHRGR